MPHPNNGISWKPMLNISTAAATNYNTHRPQIVRQSYYLTSSHIRTRVFIPILKSNNCDISPPFKRGSRSRAGRIHAVPSVPWRPTCDGGWSRAQTRRISRVRCPRFRADVRDRLSSVFSSDILRPSLEKCDSTFVFVLESPQSPNISITKFANIK